MKFNITNAMQDQVRTTVQVGDVYPAKGNARRKIAMWVVISMTESGRMVHMIGLNDEGVITTTTSYGVHAMESRERIGFVRGLSELDFNVEPIP